MRRTGLPAAGKAKKPDRRSAAAPLLAALCLLAAAYGMLIATRASVPADDYRLKAEAAALTRQCMAEIRQLKLERGIPLGAADINDTGMIGQDYSAITTTLGNLEAKRTSTNPNMAAVVVDMFHELGLKAGDKVAVNNSGSFPSLNIAVLCAAQVLELDPVIMSSLGASTHGANDPELTWLDMEHHLYETGLLRSKSVYFSVGGIRDMGGEMEPATRDAIVRRLEGLGYAFFSDDELLRNIRSRYDIYSAYGEIGCFVNVGGNDVSFGDSSVIVHADGGLLTELSENDRSTGLVQLFLQDGVPVIHLLNIKSIAAQYGLPIDPSPMPGIGEGGVYSVYAYHKWIAVAGILSAALVLWRYRGSFQRPVDPRHWPLRPASPPDRGDGGQ